MDQNTEEQVKRLNRELARLFEQSSELSEQLMALTKTARERGWDMAQYQKSRAPLQAEKQKLGVQIRERQRLLERLQAQAQPDELLPDRYRDSPAFVRFSRVEGHLEDRLVTLHEAFASSDIVLRQYVRLTPSSRGTFDGGLMAANEPTQCNEPALLPEGLTDGQAFALTYLTREAHTLFTLYFFDIDEQGFSLSLDVNPKAIYHAGDHQPGVWFESLVVRIARSVGAKVGSYGLTPAYEMHHEPLDVDDALKTVARTTAWPDRQPMVWVISDELIDKASLDRFAEGPVSPRTRMMGHYYIIGEAVPTEP